MDKTFNAKRKRPSAVQEQENDTRASDSSDEEKTSKRAKRMEYYQSDGGFVDDSDLAAAIEGRVKSETLHGGYYAAANEELEDQDDENQNYEDVSDDDLKSAGDENDSSSRKSYTKFSQSLFDYGEELDVGSLKQTRAEAIEAAKKIRQSRLEYMDEHLDYSPSNESRRYFNKLKAQCMKVYNADLEGSSEKIPEWSFQVDSLLLQFDVQTRKATMKDLEIKDLMSPWEPPKSYIAFLMGILPFPAASIQRHLRRLTEHQRCYIAYCGLRHAFSRLADWTTYKKELGLDILQKCRTFRVLLTMCVDAQYELARAQVDYR